MRRAAGSILGALGVVSLVLGLQRPAPRVRLSGPNRVVNDDRPGINAHNSPAVAVNPVRPKMVAVADRIDTPKPSCSARRSNDDGVTWGQPLALGDCFWPDVAFDRAASRPLGLPSPPNPVMASRSNDYGARHPQRIYSDLGPAPAFALDHQRDRLFAAWDAGRGDSRDVFLARSDDGGATWSAPLPVDRSFDSRIGFGSSQGLPMLGSQLAVRSEPEGALAFWSDTRSATVDDNAQDLAVANVGIDGKGEPRWLRVALGAILLLLGVGLVLRQSGGLGA